MLEAWSYETTFNNPLPIEPSTLLLFMALRAPFTTQMLLLLFLIATTLSLSLCNEEHYSTCHEQEKMALLRLKRGLTDPSKMLSSWSDKVDCCTWLGIRCNNITGRVSELNLSNPPDSPYKELSGKISPALGELESLSHLNLSFNNFVNNEIPSHLGSMKSLTHIDLSYSEIMGVIPPQLGNLSDLQYLNLGFNFALRVDDLNWVSSLSSLKYLDLSCIDFHKEDWLRVVSTLPTLTELHLEDCQIDDTAATKWQNNLTSLQVLDLSNNNLNQGFPAWLSNISASLVQLVLRGNILQGEIPEMISNFENLQVLDLQANQFAGRIPEMLGRLKNLQVIDLGINSFTGPIPSSFANLSSLRMLNLGQNKLQGTIPKSFGFFKNLQGLSLGDNILTGGMPKTLGLLSNLVKLDLGSNLLEGPVDEMHFLKLSKLKELRLSLTNLFFSINSSWDPPFQLQYLLLSSCRVGINFPTWLQKQRSLKVLVMSNSSISDQAPNWFWNWTSQLEFIDLSNNKIKGNLTNVFLNSTATILSSNQLKGQLPRVSANVQVLNIANNSVSGPISSFFCETVNGTNNLVLLDVSNNLLSGKLEHCWVHWQALKHLNLGRNLLSDEIPNSIDYLHRLESLRLHNNHFSGHIPSSLQNSSELRFIDMANNQLSGEIPVWMWEMKNLMVFRLRSNEFKGNISQNMCQLSSLIVLDLANNSLSGTIPTCLDNMQAMAVEDDISSNPLDFLYGYDLGYDNYRESLILVPKGNELEYKENLILVRMIDISSNKLSGPIPPKVCNLSALRFLNLSRNYLSGEIPKDVGSMKLLESLDLSLNHISGEIPQSMSYLSFLSFLNLSYNNLSGIIPTGTQLQSFDAQSYKGNPELCGPPLIKNYTIREAMEGASYVGQADDDFSSTSEIYMGMGVGFAVGFWVICGAIFFSRTFRHAYFQFLDQLNDLIYVTIVLNVRLFAKTISCLVSK